MHDKHKNFNSNSTICAKKPIAEYPKIKDKRPNTQENTVTIEELVDPECSKHNKSSSNQKLSKKVNYIGRNIEKPTNTGYNKEKLYLKTIGKYTPLGENILYIKTQSSSEPRYVIPWNFDISDDIYDPYALLVNINSSIHYSEEIDVFFEQDKLLSIA